MASRSNVVDSPASQLHSKVDSSTETPLRTMGICARIWAWFVRVCRCCRSSQEDGKHAPGQGERNKLLEDTPETELDEKATQIQLNQLLDRNKELERSLEAKETELDENIKATKIQLNQLLDRNKELERSLEAKETELQQKTAQIMGLERQKNHLQRSNKELKAKLEILENELYRVNQLLSKFGLGPPIGLVNQGNTCYFNAVMQVISRTFQLEDELVTQKEFNANNRSAPLTSSLLELYRCKLPRANIGGHNFDPSQILSNVCTRSSRFIGGRQQDSHELLRHLMDGVKEEEKEQNKTKSDSGPYRGLTTVDRVLGGHYLTVFSCSKCKAPYHLFEPFLDISLPIAFRNEADRTHAGTKMKEREASEDGDNRKMKYEASGDGEMSYEKSIEMLLRRLSEPKAATKVNTVLDSLRFYTRLEQLDEYLCLECNKDSDDCILSAGSKQTIVFNPPAILTVHLKRFEQTARGYTKVSCHVGFDTELELAPYCSFYAKRRQEKPSIRYSLYGVVVHNGSLQSGHYTACLRMRSADVGSVRKFIQTEFLDREYLMKPDKLIELIKAQPGLAEVPIAESKWHYVSDTSVSEISEKDVLQMEAYLLFYARVY